MSVSSPVLPVESSGNYGEASGAALWRPLSLKLIQKTYDCRKESERGEIQRDANRQDKDPPFDPSSGPRFGS